MLSAALCAGTWDKGGLASTVSPQRHTKATNTFNKYNKSNKYKLAFNLFTGTKACPQSRGEPHSHCRGLVLRQSVEPALIELLL